MAGVDLSLYVDDWNNSVDFLNRDNADIIAYLRNIKGDTLIETSRVKVMLVGPGEAGKTTLVHKLMTNKFKHNQFEMTDGVDMHTWLCEGIEFQLWDFGGQEIYMNTHAMFFETRCIYLITWNARASYASDILKLLDQYFQNVHNRAPEAPILLVSTHARDVPPLSFETLAKLRLKYPTILDYVHVDSQNGTGIAQLKRTLLEATRGLPFVLQKQPSKFVAVEDRLKEMRGPDHFALPASAFLDMAKSYHLLDKQSSLLLSLLHQWGTVHVLSKGDIVLQPQQLADVMRRVVTGKAVAEGAVVATSHGVLQHADIHTIWSAYHESLRPQFLDLLHQCELAYPLFSASGIPLYQSLVPAMLANDHSTADEMAQRCFPGFEEKRNKFGKISIKFRAHSANFFPMLQARLRAMATRDGAWQQHYFICLEDHQTGELCTALLHNDPSNCTLLMTYPLARSTACFAALRSMRYLLDEHFKALVIVGLDIEFENTKLQKNALLSRLRRDRNAVYEYHDDEDQLCKVFIGPLRVLLKELDEPVLPKPAVALTEDREPLLHGPLAQALHNIQQHSSSQPDIADLSIALIRSIPDIVRLCQASPAHVHVIWLMHVSSDGKSPPQLIPVTPGKSASDPWRLVHKASIHLVDSSVSTMDLSTESLVRKALMELGVPVARNCQLCTFGEWQDQTIAAQAKYFEKVTIADGVEAFLEQSKSLTRMSTLQQIHAKLDQVLKTVQNIDSVLQDFRRDFDIAIKRVGRQIADFSAEKLFFLSESVDSGLREAEVAPVASVDDLEGLITSMRAKLLVTDPAEAEQVDIHDAATLSAVSAPFHELLETLVESARTGKLTPGEMQRLKGDAIRSVESLSAAVHIATHNKLLSRELTQSVVARLLTEKPTETNVPRTRGTASAAPAVLTAEHVREVLKEELHAMEQRLRAHDDSYHHQLAQENVLQAQRIEEIIRRVKDLQRNVNVVRTTQVDALYRLQDLPLLLSVTDPDSSGMVDWVQRRYAKVFRVHCVCPVCGKKAPSGRNNTGYKLIITKDWVVKLTNVLTVLLKALHIVSLASPVPLPHLADLATYLPKDTSIMKRGLTTLLEETQAMVEGHFGELRENDELPAAAENAFNVAITNPNAPSNSSGASSVVFEDPPLEDQQLSFSVTLEYVTSVISLLNMMEDTVPPEHSELCPVRHKELDQFAWVCKDSTAGIDSPAPLRAPTRSVTPSRVRMRLPTVAFNSSSTAVSRDGGIASDRSMPTAASYLNDDLPVVSSTEPGALDCLTRFSKEGNRCLRIIISKD